MSIELAIIIASLSFTVFGGIVVWSNNSRRKQLPECIGALKDIVQSLRDGRQHFKENDDRLNDHSERIIQVETNQKNMMSHLEKIDRKVENFHRAWLKKNGNSGK